MDKSTEARRLEDKLGIKIVVSDAVKQFEAIVLSQEEFDKIIDKVCEEAAGKIWRSLPPMPFCPERAPGE